MSSTIMLGLVECVVLFLSEDGDSDAPKKTGKRPGATRSGKPKAEPKKGELLLLCSCAKVKVPHLAQAFPSLLESSCSWMDGFLRIVFHVILGGTYKRSVCMRAPTTCA